MAFRRSKPASLLLMTSSVGCLMFNRVNASLLPIYSRPDDVINKYLRLEAVGLIRQ